MLGASAASPASSRPVFSRSRPTYGIRSHAARHPCLRCGLALAFICSPFCTPCAFSCACHRCCKIPVAARGSLLLPLPPPFAKVEMCSSPLGSQPRRAFLNAKRGRRRTDEKAHGWDLVLSRPGVGETRGWGRHQHPGPASPLLGGEKVQKERGKKKISEIQGLSCCALLWLCFCFYKWGSWKPWQSVLSGSPLPQAFVRLRALHASSRISWLALFHLTVLLFCTF